MTSTTITLAGLALACALAGCTAPAKDQGAANSQQGQQGKGLLTVPSDYSAAESLQRIQDTLKAKGIAVFTVIDHQAAARQAQLDMPAASVIVFGNPKLGTPMMRQSPSLAIDLPSKALVWEDAQGKVFVTLNTADYLGQRHQLPPDMVQALQGLEKLVPSAVKKAP